MGIFKKILRTGESIGREIGRDASRTYKKTIGRGARNVPSFRQIGKVVQRYSPYTGFRRVTRTLRQQPKRKGARRRR